MSDTTITNTPAQTVTSQVQQVGPETPDGELLGKASTSKVAFYGKTPVTQPTNAAQAAVTVSTITTASTTTTPWGFATSTQADNLAASCANAVTLVNRLRTDLVTLGIIKGA